MLFIGNLTMQLAWLRVVLILAFDENARKEEEACETKIHTATITALAFSLIELLNSLLGLTKSKPHQVMLFSLTRTGVEMLLAPLLPCGCIEHIITVSCWALDGIIRFGCFGADALLSMFGYESVPFIKSIRYTIGPMLFPIGAGGEMFMVIKAAKEGRTHLYFAAALWPIFFYPLMKQLLKQRSKHFKKLKEA